MGRGGIGWPAIWELAAHNPNCVFVCWYPCSGLYCGLHFLEERKDKRGEGERKTTSISKDPLLKNPISRLPKFSETAMAQPYVINAAMEDMSILNNIVSYLSLTTHRSNDDFPDNQLGNSNRRINVAWRRYWFAFIREDFANIVNRVERHHGNIDNPPYLLRLHDLADVLAV